MPRGPVSSVGHQAVLQGLSVSDLTIPNEPLTRESGHRAFKGRRRVRTSFAAMHRPVAFSLLLCLIGLPGMLLQPALVLRVTTGDGVALICTRVAAGTAVVLEFTHSMYGGFVREMYRIDSDGDLKRQRIITENAAAAEYYALDGRTQRVDDVYEVLGTPFRTKRLVVRVDTRGNHRLTIGATVYRLTDILPDSTQIAVRVERTSRIPFFQSCDERLNGHLCVSCPESARTLLKAG